MPALWHGLLPALAALGLALAVDASAADPYPVKPVKIVVPFAPGGIADLTSRQLAEAMSRGLGQQVVVENRPSAGSIVASELVAKSRPDGYTLLLVSNGNAVSASLFKSLPYDVLRDFAPVSTVGFFDLVLLVGANSKLMSLADLLAYARANPGRLNIGTIAIGSTQNLSAELFKSMAGIDAQTVPHKNTPEVVAALRRKDVDAAFEILGPVSAQIRAGVVRPLGVTGTKRFAGLPEVPTLAEAGLPGYQASSWNGIAAPAGTPRTIVDRINHEIRAALEASEVAARMHALGVAARASTPEELHALMAGETAKWKAVIERAGIPRQ